MEKEKIKRYLESIDIEDVEEAREFIARAIEEGTLPIISVPEEYVEAVKDGIRPSATWIGEEIIAGTIARSPYAPSSEARRFLEVDVPADQLEPRFTGPDKHFHGVVVFRGPISPEAIHSY